MILIISFMFNTYIKHLKIQLEKKTYFVEMSHKFVLKFIGKLL